MLQAGEGARDGILRAQIEVEQDRQAGQQHQAPEGALQAVPPGGPAQARDQRPAAVANEQQGHAGPGCVGQRHGGCDGRGAPGGGQRQHRAHDRPGAGRPDETQARANGKSPGKVAALGATCRAGAQPRQRRQPRLQAPAQGRHQQRQPEARQRQHGHPAQLVGRHAERHQRGCQHDAEEGKADRQPGDDAQRPGAPAAARGAQHQGTTGKMQGDRMVSTPAKKANIKRIITAVLLCVAPARPRRLGGYKQNRRGAVKVPDACYAPRSLTPPGASPPTPAPAAPAATRR